MMGMRLLAIHEGDLSGTIVHPALIHAAHVCGFAAWQVQHSRFSCGTEDYLLRLAEDALAGLENERDKSPNWFFSCIYVYIALGGFHLFRRHLEPYMNYLRRAADLINNSDVQSMIDEFLTSDYPVPHAEMGPYVGAINTAEGAKSQILEDQFDNFFLEVVYAVAKVAFFDWSTAPFLGRAALLNDSVGTQLARLKVRFAEVLSWILLTMRIQCRRIPRGHLALP
jgi:hypothetical protein